MHILQEKRVKQVKNRRKTLFLQTKFAECVFENDGPSEHVKQELDWKTSCRAI